MREVKIVDIDGTEHIFPRKGNFDTRLYEVTLRIAEVGEADGNLLMSFNVLNSLGFVTKPRLAAAGVSFANHPPRVTNDVRAAELLRELLQLVHPIPDPDEG